MDFGKVFIAPNGDEFIEKELKSLGKNAQAKFISIEGVRGKFKRYKYKELLLETGYEGKMLWVDMSEISPQLKNELQEINMKNTIIVLNYKNKEQLKFASGLKFKDGIRAVEKQSIKTWKDKYNACYLMLENMGFYDNLFDKAETKKLLVKLMVREPEKWDDVFLSLNIYKSQNKYVDMPLLETVFDDVDFYKLDDWIRDVLIGDAKQKTHKIANYYMENKSYSPNWIINKIREAVLDIGVVYEAYRLGILYDGFESDNEINQRGEVRNFWGTIKLQEMKVQRKKWCLYMIKFLDYPYFVKIQKVIFADTVRVEDKIEVYYLIDSLREARREYAEQ